MADNYYDAGTATVVNGSTAVTGTGTTWSTWGLLAGDTLNIGGIGVPIASVNSNTSLTLAYGWPGVGASAVAHVVQYTSPRRSGADIMVKVRELLAQIDLLGGAVPYYEVVSLGANTPPASPTAGDLYVVGTSPTGAWAGQAKNIASWTGSVWKFTVPDGGWHAYSKAVNLQYAYVAGSWQLTDGVASVAGNTGTVTAAQLKDAVATAFVQTILDDADAAAVRATIGAVNRTGDSSMSGAFTSNSGAFIANNTTNVSGTITGGAFRSDTSSGGTQFAQFLCQNQVGVAIRAALLAVNGATVGSLTINQAGNCVISGSLSKASGTFLIDHPLDPYNRDLAHGFVEAPEYQNRYRGLVRLVDGRATVDIDAVAGMTPGTFAALNADAWVAGLQNQEGFARLRSGPLIGASFEIICEDDASTDLVAWEVTARRNDAFVRSGIDPNTDAEGNFIPEREKPE